MRKYFVDFLAAVLLVPATALPQYPTHCGTDGYVITWNSGSGQFQCTAPASVGPSAPVAIYSTGLWNASQIDNGSYATNANFYVPLQSVTISKIYAVWNTATAGDIYSVFVATVDTSYNITGTVATASSRFTTPATGLQGHTFSIPSTTLAAGTAYIVGLVITSGSSTSQCRGIYNNTAGSWIGMPTDLVATINSFADNRPRRINYTQNSDAPTTGAPFNNTQASATALILLN